MARQKKADQDKPDVRSYVVRLDPDGQRAVRVLAAELDTTVQDLTLAALNDFLAKHGKKGVTIRNPRARRLER
jgi:hypothetical protein